MWLGFLPLGFLLKSICREYMQQNKFVLWKFVLWKFAMRRQVHKKVATHLKLNSQKESVSFFNSAAFFVTILYELPLYLDTTFI